MHSIFQSHMENFNDLPIPNPFIDRIVALDPAPDVRAGARGEDIRIDIAARFIVRGTPNINWTRFPIINAELTTKLHSVVEKESIDFIQFQENPPLDKTIFVGFDCSGIAAGIYTFNIVGNWDASGFSGVFLAGGCGWQLSISGEPVRAELYQPTNSSHKGSITRSFDIEIRN